MVSELNVGALVVVATVVAAMAWFATGLSGTARITTTLIVWVVALAAGVVVTKLLGGS